MDSYLKGGFILSKVFWVAVGITGLLTAVANVPGFFGIIAIVGLWYVVRKWKQQSFVPSNQATAFTSDPITNFEKQWQELNK